MNVFVLITEHLLLLFVDPPRSEDPLEYFNREVQKRRDEEANLWSTPGDPSHSEREDDRVLYSLLQARNKTRMGSSVRQAKRERADTQLTVFPFRETFHLNLKLFFFRGIAV